MTGRGPLQLQTRSKRQDQSQKIRERRSKLQSEQEKEPGMTVRFLLVLSIVVLLSLSSTAQNPGRIQTNPAPGSGGRFWRPVRPRRQQLLPQRQNPNLPGRPAGERQPPRTQS